MQAAHCLLGIFKSLRRTEHGLQLISIRDVVAVTSLVSRDCSILSVHYGIN